MGSAHRTSNPPPLSPLAPTPARTRFANTTQEWNVQGAWKGAPPPLFSPLQPPSRENRTGERNVGAWPPCLRRGHGNVPPLPLSPSFSPTHATTGHPNRMRSLHPFHPPPSFARLYAHNSSPTCLQPPLERGNNMRMNTH